MKKLAIWTIFSLFSLTLVACAGMSGERDVKVKCPSCGYEFHTDMTGN